MSINIGFEKRITKLTWWIYWRWLLLSLLGPILGACSGALLGFIMGMSGVHLDNIKIITGVVGGVIGLSVAFFGLRFLVKRAVEHRVLGFHFEIDRQADTRLERY
ncbi:hypothetical protein [Brucella sp. NBRC 12950]|uniref:hypothetical protein n=1 Tax=Brucella sp. NBRC 12950 TaxID=2994518 RepID=UPI0024A3A191|nr:hypothetical protein [Brucella sp. NBRC 12950]GLU28266.1 hypothetical protein Brsp01_34990 [Brucella sp. NBRC 12950]